MFMVEYSNFTLVWYSKNLSTYVTRHLYVSISCWLSPGQFVIRKSAFLSSISDKFCSLLLYSLQSQFFFLRLSRPVVTRSSLPPVDQGFPEDLLEILGWLVKGEDSLHTFLELQCTIAVLAEEDLSRSWLLSHVFLCSVLCLWSKIGETWKDTDETTVVERHLLFCSVDLVSISYMPEPDEGPWRQRNPCRLNLMQK